MPDITVSSNIHTFMQLATKSTATNDTPKLNEDKIHIGNSSNQSTTKSLSTAISGVGAAIVSICTTAPSSTPSKAGDIFMNTTAGDVYIAKGPASSANLVLVS